jgi:hypothetical protein
LRVNTVLPIDPDSYRLREDEETKGALWCAGPGCTNYYRYLEHPVVRHCVGKNFLDFLDPHSPVFECRIRGVVASRLPVMATEMGRTGPGFRGGVDE